MTGPSAQRKRILSGVQPSGRLHLGNYFGAIRQHLDLQAEGECYYFIANYHSLTTVRDRALLEEQTHDVAVTYLALGLDPERTVFYRQSDVPEVAELTWLLATVTGMGLLERAHSYKEKIAKGITPSVGLFLYPCLMAADILGPRGEVVPVGKDQEQHVEITRDIAQAFHRAFCKDGDEVFALPAPRFSKTPKVPGTTFEKGTVVQVDLVVDPRHADGGPVDLDAVAAAYRERLRAIAAAIPEDGSTTTEDVARQLDAEPMPALQGVSVLACTLRTQLEMPGENVHVTPGDEGKLRVEFAVPLDRTVFVTRDGRRTAAKMSKSYGNTIDIFAEGKPLKRAVMGIETYLKELHEPLDPEGDIVIELFSLFASDAEVADLEAKYRAGGFGYGGAKKWLLEKIDGHFEPYRAKRKELLEDRGYVEDVLRDGAKRARSEIRKTLEAARAACGIPKLT